MLGSVANSINKWLHKMHILFLGPTAVKTTVICADLQFFVLSSLNILTLGAIHLQNLSSKDKVGGKSVKNKPLWITCTHRDYYNKACGCMRAVIPQYGAVIIKVW